MQLFGCPNTRSTRAAWALEEAGLEYEYIVVDIKKGEGFQSPAIDLNPAGKIPILIDDEGLVLTESAAICMYIGELVPELGLVPALGRAKRAMHDEWCFFAVSELEQPLWLISKHTAVFPEAYRVPAVIESAKWEFDAMLDVVADGLGDSSFILGEHFTIADILLSHGLTWAARGLKIPLRHANLDAYMKRTQARPALARAREREKLEMQLKENAV